MGQKAGASAAALPSLVTASCRGLQVQTDQPFTPPSWGTCLPHPPALTSLLK